MSVIDDEDRIWRARCAEAPDGWPFDADRDDPLTAHRIAVTGAYPGWYYLVCFDQESEARPDDRETAMLVSFLAEYKERWYGGGGYRRAMERRPLDVDGGANGTIFHKYGADNWGYRKQTWRGGPTFWPGGEQWYRDKFCNGAPAHSLPALMDHIHTIGSDGPTNSWVEWKAAHPEVFG